MSKARKAGKGRQEEGRDGWMVCEVLFGTEIVFFGGPFRFQNEKLTGP